MRPAMRLRLLCREGMDACNRGEFDNALFQLHMALDVARAMEHPLLEAKVRSNTGLVLYLRKEHARALAHLRAARDLVAEHAGTDNRLHRSLTENIAAAGRALARAAA